MNQDQTAPGSTLFEEASKTFQQMTKQGTFVVIGAFMVKARFFY